MFELESSDYCKTQLWIKLFGGILILVILADETKSTIIHIPQLTQNVTRTALERLQRSWKFPRHYCNVMC